MTSARGEFKPKAELALDHIGVVDYTYSETNRGQSWCFIYQCQGESWPLRLFIPACDLSVLPAVYWNEPTVKWLWPHTSSNGEICFSDAIGLEFNPKDLIGVFGWVLDQACKLLSKNNTLSLCERSFEFADELESYVRQFGAQSVILKNDVSSSCSLYVQVSKPNSNSKPNIPVPQYIHHG